MNIVDETLFQCFEKKNWDFYRNNYLDGKYTFEDLVEFNNKLRKKLKAIGKDQIHYHLDWIEEFLSSVTQERPEILELGCWEGNLAVDIFYNEKYNFIEEWMAFDICSDAVHIAEGKDIDVRFTPVYMHHQIWEQEINFDVFISCHTVEHLSKKEVLQLLEWINNSSCEYVYIEAPIPEAGKIWRKGASTHVLNGFGRRHFRRFFKRNGWEVIFEKEAGKLAWCIGVKRD